MLNFIARMRAGFRAPYDSLGRQGAWNGCMVRLMAPYGTVTDVHRPGLVVRREMVVDAKKHGKDEVPVQFWTGEFEWVPQALLRRVGE